MDTATLVDERIKDGQKLIEHLNHNGVEVDAALWALTSEDGLWFFYISSPIVDAEGLAKAYRKVYTELARCPVEWITRSDIRLLGSGSEIAKDAITYQSQRNIGTRYGGRKLGNLIIEEAYIYPKSPSDPSR